MKTRICIYLALFVLGMVVPLLGCGEADEGLDLEVPVAYEDTRELGEAQQSLAIKTSGTATLGAQPSQLNRQRCNNSSTGQSCNYLYSSQQNVSEYRIRTTGFSASEKTALEGRITNFCSAMAQKVNAINPPPTTTFSCFLVGSGESILISKAIGGGTDGNVGSYASPIYSSCFTVPNETLPGTYNSCAKATINYALAALETRMTNQGFSASQKANGRLRVEDHAMLAAMGFGGQSDTSGIPSFNGVIGDPVGGVMDATETCRFRALKWSSNFDVSTITSTTGC